MKTQDIPKVTKNKGYTLSYDSKAKYSYYFTPIGKIDAFIPYVPAICLPPYTCVSLYSLVIIPGKGFDGSGNRELWKRKMQQPKEGRT